MQGVILGDGLEMSAPKGISQNLRSPARKIKYRIDISNRSYIIGRAYDEPLFCDHVENILLQRNFIID